MKKFARITAVLTAVFMLVLSMGVSAAIIEPVEREVLLSQNFAGLSELPEGWSVKKNGQVSGVATAPAFNPLGLTTNQKNNLWVGCDDAFDAGNRDYTVDLSFSKMGDGSFNFVIGGNEDWYKNMTGTKVQSQASSVLVPSEAGYTLQLNVVSASDSLTLYKNGTPIIQKRIDTELLTSSGKGSGSVSGLNTYDAKLEVTDTKTILTVVAVSKSNTVYTGVFEYEDANPVKSGYAGIYSSITLPSADGSTGTVYNMSVTAEASTKATEGFFLNKVFSDADTAEDIADLGFVINNENAYYPIEPTASGLQLLAPGYGKSELILDKYVFDGTYNIRSSVTFSYNNYGYYLNYVDKNNYYRLNLGSLSESGSVVFSGFILSKVVDGVETELARKDYSEINKYMFWAEPSPVEIKVINETGKTTIEVVGYKLNEAYEWSYTDENAPISSGKIGIRPNSCGETYLKSIKIYSEEPVYTAGAKSGEDVVLSLPYMPWKVDDTKVITAVYSADETKEFVKADIKSFADFADGSAVVLPAGDNTGNIEIRTFVWDGLENMRPITNPIVIRPEA